MLRALFIMASMLTLAATLACTGSSTRSEYCPDFSQDLDESRPIDKPPTLQAEAGGRRVTMNGGPSEWCHIVSDQFEVVTGQGGLSVSPGKTIDIRNPRRDALVVQSIDVQGPQPEPTPRGDRLVWPHAGWTGGSGRRESSFAAPEEPGTYIVVVRVQYERVGTPEFAVKRQAHYAFVVEVTGD